MAEGEERPDRSLRGRRMLNTGRTFRPAQKPKACRRHDSHIRRTLTDVTEVRHHAIMPGRLLRVRFPWATPAAGRMLGVVCAYQHAWAPKDTHILEKRHDFWQKLSRCTAGVPQREMMIFGGDLNVQLTPLHPHVGHGTGVNELRMPTLHTPC